jgi:hypothetical protein
VSSWPLAKSLTLASRLNWQFEQRWYRIRGWTGNRARSRIRSGLGEGARRRIRMGRRCRSRLGRSASHGDRPSASPSTFLGPPRWIGGFVNAHLHRRQAIVAGRSHLGIVGLSAPAPGWRMEEGSAHRAITFGTSPTSVVQGRHSSCDDCASKTHSTILRLKAVGGNGSGRRLESPAFTPKPSSPGGARTTRPVPTIQGRQFVEFLASPRQGVT